MIDAAWSTKLEPLLRAKFPAATDSELKAAHGYSYGGAIIQDLGYYPHGNKRFSDLTHYIRTGDFVKALLDEAKDLNEFAFALGALSHHASDSDVHRLATNPGEAKLYPRLARRFGPIVTYENDPAAHLKTEFGFDVLEVAKGHFAPEAYHDFIGFGVCAGVLDRAFYRTYGLRLSDLFPDIERGIGSYRRAVSITIPTATRIAWAEREHDIQASTPRPTRRQFVYVMTRSNYEQQWGMEYDHPTIRDRVAAVLLKLIPPVGPLRVLRFRMPTPEVEQLFAESFNKSLADYNSHLDMVRVHNLHLTNVNYDLGEPAKSGTYRLQDETYAFWQQQLTVKESQTATAEARQQVDRDSAGLSSVR